MKYFFAANPSKLDSYAVKSIYLAFAINLFLLLVFCIFRPLTPHTETRYLTVAWEMFSNANYLVPTLNTETYAHKPILLFWIIIFFWKIFGISEVAARLSIAFFSLASLIATFFLSKTIYPNNQNTPLWAPLILSAFPLWGIFSGALMFDCMVCFFSLLQILFMRLYCRSASFSYAVLAGLFSGIGLLSKGPVLFVYTLPVLFCYPLWKDDDCIVSYSAWYLSLLISFFIGVTILFSWALSAAYFGGNAYGQELLWNQTVDRLSGVLAHNRPIYWYLMFIPLLLTPIALETGKLKLKSLFSIDRNDYFCLLWFVLPFIFLSIIKSKQLHYLLPTLPALSILLASKKIKPQAVLTYIIITLSCIICFTSHYLVGLVTSEKISFSLYQPIAGLIAIAWGIGIFVCKQKEIKTALCLQSVPLCLGLIIIANMLPLYSYGDMAPIAQKISTLQKENQTVAVWGKYRGEYGFYGKLQKKIKLVKDFSWLQQNPDAIILYKTKQNNSKIKRVALASFNYRSRKIYFISSRDCYALLKSQTMGHKNSDAF